MYVPRILYYYILLYVHKDYSGDIGPFQLAILLTVVTLFLILPWRENFGTSSENTNTEKDNNDKNKNSIENKKEEETIIEWLQTIMNLFIKNPIILCVGLSQACFEGAVYTFG